MRCAYSWAMTVIDMDVKSIRKALGESQEVFGDRFGVNQTTVHRWETKGIPARGTARTAIHRLVCDLLPPDREGLS